MTVRRYSFVWVRGPNGPQPQKWSPEAFEVSEARMQVAISIRELTPAEWEMSLAALAKRYPPPDVIL